MKLVAYGSLINKSSLEETLGRDVAYELIAIKDYARIFDAPFGEYAFLNLTNIPGAQFEAACFSIKQSELSKFEVREAGSILLEIKPDHFAFVSPAQKCKNLPVLQSYIDVCEKGCNLLGISLWTSTIRPKTIINDRANPLYP